MLSHLEVGLACAQILKPAWQDAWNRVRTLHSKALIRELGCLGTQPFWLVLLSGTTLGLVALAVNSDLHHYIVADMLDKLVKV